MCIVSLLYRRRSN